MREIDVSTNPASSPADIAVGTGREDQSRRGVVEVDIAPPCHRPPTKRSPNLLLWKEISVCGSGCGGRIRSDSALAVPIAREHTHQYIVVEDATDERALALTPLLPESALLVAPDRAQVVREHSNPDAVQGQRSEGKIKHETGHLGA